MSVREVGVNKLAALTKTVKCQVAIGETGSASASCVGIETFVAEFRLSKDEMSDFNSCCDILVELCQNSKEVKKVNIALSLIKSYFQLVKRSDVTNEHKLDKYNQFGALMQDLSKNMASQGFGEKFKEEFPFMDALLEEIQNIGFVDLRKKALTVAKFLHSYGSFASNLSEPYKTIELFKQAVCLLETVYAKEAAQYKLLGTAFHHMGTAKEAINQNTAANIYFNKALAAYDKATDWSSGEKSQYVNDSKAHLSAVQGKLR